MVQHRSGGMAVYLSQIFVVLGLVLLSLPVIDGSTTKKEIPQSYNVSVDTTVCNCAALRTDLGVCKAISQNKCDYSESETKIFFDYLEQENITAQCLPGREIKRKTREIKENPREIKRKPREIKERLSNNSELFILRLIAVVFAVQLIILLILALRQSKGNSKSRQELLLNNNDFDTVFTEAGSNEFCMISIGESNERSILLNSNNDSCNDKPSDNDKAEYSQKLQKSTDDESDNDIPVGSSQKSLPSKIRGSSEAGTSTEPNTLRRRRLLNFRRPEDKTPKERAAFRKLKRGSVATLLSAALDLSPRSSIVSSDGDKLEEILEVQLQAKRLKHAISSQEFKLRAYRENLDKLDGTSHTMISRNISMIEEHTERLKRELSSLELKLNEYRKNSDKLDLEAEMKKD